MAFATTHMTRPVQTTADAMQAGVRRMLRIGLLVLGGLIMAVGAVLALFPFHVGVPLLVVGLMVVLRKSLPARKEFIRLQRRHPNWVFPLRRLMRREPEVIPVVWQQVLRTERLVLPARYRFVRRLRVSYFRRAKKSA